MAAYDVAARRARSRTLGFSLSGVYADWVQRRREQRAVAQLRSMPDHILADLGLDRAGIEHAVRHGRW
ncbi:MAG: DUF1127 domain-containing protein [Pseudomonadota bacterium]